ncbi:hypothetical protein CANCADRAFT_1207 [Tortispora caseinolytica NRRL Y-17796]|uniref:Mannose-6-phosphate isomerase n=1 Tax=Tortispora caseinolytica NRRL Y-17796 TaxID=767744 RepID=A0A1E4TLH2_9ASCO|nr:hypothetical protein CANCADRAFT_1207 [Tortispora caseinolytica NRRL Y-17796]
MFKITCGYQNYDWGKLGSDSSVARFKHVDPAFVIDESAPYAELWMGTHPKVPSMVNPTTTLLQALNDHPEYSTPAITRAFKAPVPFLFKVLSIRKALSIQAHPDKQLAERLHAADPKNYPDDNHKPEMAVALTQFEGFCGFRPLEQIAAFLDHVPPFRDIIGMSGAELLDTSDERAQLQLAFSRLMNTADVTAQTAQLVALAKSETHSFGPFVDASFKELILRLNEQFPNDIGLFCGPMFLNYVKLDPGQAMFLQANVPHAYISGDIIECMAASDNVVRAGFTPKFKDVRNLVDMLTYEMAPIDDQIMKEEAFARCTGDGKVSVYDPPISEFAVLKVEVGESQQTQIEPLEGPSISIVTQGEGVVSVPGSDAIDRS